MKNKKHSILIILLFVFVAIILSCINKQNNVQVESLKSIVQNNLGKKLILSDSIRIYSPFSNCIYDSLELSNAKFKIYTKINASCGTCVEKIKIWNSLVPEFNKYKVPIILICESMDEFELLSYMCESKIIKNFSYPFFLDVKNEFSKKNKFMAASKNFETVLTDRNNTILLMGNPMVSKGIKELYLKEIQKRIKDE